MTPESSPFPGDIIEEIKGSLVQHGPHNDRVYLMRFKATGETSLLIERLDCLARKNYYGKIFAKIPAPDWPAFKAAGFLREAFVPGFFYGSIDGLFISKYFTRQRGEAELPTELKQLLSSGRPADFRSGNGSATVDDCTDANADEISAVYREVFSSYPFPIQDSDYLQKAMQEGVRYFCIREQGRIAALAAAEIDREYKNAELTDFATLPGRRKKGYAGILLDHMEHTLQQAGILTAFTIARAVSTGMNIVFRNNGYTFSGFLKNNTNIGSGIESMTVWHKHLGRGKPESLSATG